MEVNFDSERKKKRTEAFEIAAAWISSRTTDSIVKHTGEQLKVHQALQKLGHLLTEVQRTSMKFKASILKDNKLKGPMKAVCQANSASARSMSTRSATALLGTTDSSAAEAGI